MRILIVSGLCLGIAATAVAAQDFDFRRQMTAGTRFAIRNIVGDVRVEGTTGREVVVTAVRHAGRRGDPEDVEIRAVESDGVVAICVFYPGQRVSSGRDRDRDDRDRVRRDRDRDREDRRSRSPDVCQRDGNWSNNERNDTRVDIVARVPAGLRLDIKTVAGDVFAAGLRGEIDLASVSGNVELRDGEGDIVEAASVSGDVTLDGVRAREIGAETVSGDVTFDGPINARGLYDFKTLSGNVVLTLPREPDARVSASTFSGNLDSAFPVDRDNRRRSRNRFSATWGAGTAQLDLQSFSGNIRIRSAR